MTTPDLPTMAAVWPWVLAAVGGYLLGSVPVAVLVARWRGVDPRRAGDHNPGHRNVEAKLGWAAAVPVLVGDTLKGALAGLFGLAVGGSVWVAYAAVGAAIAGHGWPLFASFRGGRSVLTFIGGFAVLCPPAFVLGIALCLLMILATGSFALGALSGVLSAPLLQLLFAPPDQVVATGGLMALIGLRFALALVAARIGERRGRS